MIMQLKNITGLFVFILVSFLLMGMHCSKAKIQKETEFLMDTYVTIQAPGNKKVRSIIFKAFNRMHEIDRKFNILNQDNDLYRFNNQNEPIGDEEIRNIVETALEISKKSDGAFDITIYPLMKLWGFFDKVSVVPDSGRLIEKLSLVDYSQIQIEDGLVKKTNPNARIDLGGIAKGLAIREAYNVLKANNIKSGLIDAGGDIYAFGKLHDRPWKVGIRNPWSEGVIGVLDVDDAAVVTSGDYERFFIEDSVKYHHLLNPETGYPARGLSSVTVISFDPVIADAWSTALFVMGLEKGLELVNKTTDIEAIFATSDREIIRSSGLNQ